MSALDRAVGKPGPDVVATDQVPAFGAFGVGKPLNRRPRLATRRLSDRHYARRALAAFIDRGVDIGQPPGYHLTQCHTYSAGVRADDDVSVIIGRCLTPVHDISDVAAGVADNELDLATENAAMPVDFRNSQRAGIY